MLEKEDKKKKRRKSAKSKEKTIKLKESIKNIITK